MPEVDLGDYKKTSKEVNNEKEEEIQVTDEEVENTILDIRRSRAPKVDMTKMTEEDIKKIEENKDSNLPEFNDEFVRALGPFENTEDFKEKLKENLKLEKTNQAREKKRLKIVEKILEDTKVEVPEILTNMEVDKILARMESDIANMGMQFEEYLKHLNKTREDLFKEFTPDGEKKAKLGLILNKIAKVESIVADAEEVEKEVAHIMEHYAGADKDQVRIYAENILTNEKIFKFLEALK
jgi:FKBP-type peptidyl-prolyl cis-trans isomerase (trigger factor)